jgi:pimeloyl-ACP methyl ester carboxylesterase
METINWSVKHALAIVAGGILAAGCGVADEGSQPPPAVSPTPNRTAEGHYAAVNGLKMYYEVTGTGTPLVLLHGGVADAEAFDPILPLLARDHRVIAVDLQAHGRTADIDRPLSFEAMAEDVAALVAQLRLQTTDIMGYSLGGAVALQTAIRHPEIVRKLVVVSTVFKSDGWYPENRAGMAAMGPEVAEMAKQSPLYQQYARIAPRVEDWPVLFTKLGELFRKDYDWSVALPTIKAPTMLVFGDADAVRTAHAVEFFGRLGGGQRDGGWDGSGVPTTRLAILPRTTHYQIFMSPELAAAVLPFLADAPATESPR